MYHVKVIEVAVLISMVFGLPEPPVSTYLPSNPIPSSNVPDVTSNNHPIGQPNAMYGPPSQGSFDGYPHQNSRDVPNSNFNHLGPRTPQHTYGVPNGNISPPAGPPQSHDLNNSNQGSFQSPQPTSNNENSRGPSSSYGLPQNTQNGGFNERNFPKPPAPPSQLSSQAPQETYNNPQKFPSPPSPSYGVSQGGAQESQNSYNPPNQFPSPPSSSYEPPQDAVHGSQSSYSQFQNTFKQESLQSKQQNQPFGSFPPSPSSSNQNTQFQQGINSYNQIGAPNAGEARSYNPSQTYGQPNFSNGISQSPNQEAAPNGGESRNHNPSQAYGPPNFSKGISQSPPTQSQSYPSSISSNKAAINDQTQPFQQKGYPRQQTRRTSDKGNAAPLPQSYGSPNPSEGHSQPFHSYIPPSQSPQLPSNDLSYNLGRSQFAKPQFSSGAQQPLTMQMTDSGYSNSDSYSQPFRNQGSLQSQETPQSAYGPPIERNSNSPTGQFSPPATNSHRPNSETSNNRKQQNTGNPNNSRPGSDKNSGGAGQYEFNYQVNDQSFGTQFSQTESRRGQEAQGQYNVLLPDGRKQTVDYRADSKGFRSNIKYEGEKSNQGASGASFGNSSGYPRENPNQYQISPEVNNGGYQDSNSGTNSGSQGTFQGNTQQQDETGYRYK